MKEVFWDYRKNVQFVKVVSVCQPAYSVRQTRVSRKSFKFYLIGSDVFQSCFNIERSRDVNGSRLRSNLKQNTDNYLFKQKRHW